MATSFKQVANNAQSTAASGAFNNTTSPLTFSVQTGHGARFPSPGNGFYLTVWNSASYPDPFSDPNMEIVLCTARTTDSLTVTRGQRGTTATAKTGSPDVRLLVDSTHISDLQTAVNAIENVVIKYGTQASSATVAPITLTYGHTYSSAPVVICSVHDDSGAVDAVFAVIDTIGTTSAVANLYDHTGTAVVNTGYKVQWLAIGS
jgi:hypothetical protein